MKYDLSLPDVTHRRPFLHCYLTRGSVVAFSYGTHNEERTGILVMESDNWFLAAVNLYDEEGYIWQQDQLPDNIQLYEATDEETAWGHRYFFEHEYISQSVEGKHPIIAFVERECPKQLRSRDYASWEFCMNMLCEFPDWDYIDNKKEFAGDIWKEAIKSANQGLEFNPYRAEMFCFLIAILMITENVEEEERSYYIYKLRKEWDHFSWMYSMIVGRLIGTDMKTFTAMVNMLDNKKRGCYIRLYLPLVESNIDKICKYSNVEKRYKLEAAINKMKLTEERHEQSKDLDDLFEILFPKHFRKMMNEARPASSIKEMKEELAKKDEQIDHWRNTAESLSEKLNELTTSMKAQVEESLSLEDVTKAILSMSIDEARMVFHSLDYKLRHNAVWQKGRIDLLDKLETKELGANGTTVGTNNGIVAGGNLNTNIQFTNEQVQMLINQLSLTGEQSSKLLNFTNNGNNNTR